MKTILSAEQIAVAKKECLYSSRSEQHHEHDDCVRIAYEWLDAQNKLQKPQSGRSVALKHVVESWGGRYVSQSDLDVAAHLHPEIVGKYPHYNLSKKLVRPANLRLEDIAEAGTMPNYHKEYGADTYTYIEKDGGEIVKKKDA